MKAMPRLTTQSPDFEAVGDLFRSKKATGRSLGAAIGCSHTTACKKLAHPEKFTLGDLDKAARRYGIPFEKVRAAIVK